jgi:hypothetical protein
LQQLQGEFELTDKQLAALPFLSKVDLVPQANSHLIEHTELTPFTYHSYKHFVGESFNESSHVYLYRTAGSKRQYQLEITSITLERNAL